MSEENDYDPTCLAVGHDDVLIYEDDEVWQGECSRCGAELWEDKEPAS